MLQALQKGVTIPTAHRAPKNYGDVLLQLGLVPITQAPKGTKRKQTGEKAGRGKAPGGR